MADPKATRKALFSEELGKTLKKLAQKYEMDAPQPIVIEKDGVLFISGSVHEVSAKNDFERWFLEQCEDLGLKKEWLKATIVTFESQRKLTIVGLDPNGGHRCVRLRDERNNHFFMSPDEVSRTMMHISIPESSAR